MTERLIIDTDPGIDDAAAILLALASPELTVEAITTVFGNGYVEQSTRNALTILDIAGQTGIPVYKGVSKPLMRNPIFGHQVHGQNAFGEIDFPESINKHKPQHAVLALIDLITTYPGKLTLVCLGPLTNVALAFSLEPKLATMVKELILMGGAIYTNGNASEVASANFFYDPEAVAILYGSGAQIVQIGLDVCQKVQLSAEQFGRIRDAKKPCTDMLAQITPKISSFYMSKGRLSPGSVVQYNDMVAIAYCVNSELFDYRHFFIQISTHEELTRGQTVADVNKMRGMSPNAKVLMDVCSDDLVEMFIKRMVNI